MIHGRNTELARRLANIVIRATVLFVLLMAGNAPAARAIGTPPPFVSYLPIVTTIDSFGLVPAIWSHKSQPQSLEVSLFRYRFNINTGFNALQLQVFADTRYEIYMDGVFIGRGPARFSKQTHEYDVYDIPTLSAGQHVIAALVQWSPNTRRSESVQPELKVRLKVGNQTVAQTDPNWKTQLSTAWNANAAPVHVDQLIGATELLDLNALPANWMQINYDDTSWQYAVVQPYTSARSSPRSIPALANVLMPAKLLSSGQLAPGMTPMELQPDAKGEFTFSVDATTNGSRLLIKTLAQPVAVLSAQHDSFGMSVSPQREQAAAQPPMQIQVNGAPITWTNDVDWHPDYRQVSAVLGQGRQTLKFTNVPAGGWPVLISLNEAELGNVPVTQGANAGQRLLLSQPAIVTGTVGYQAQGENIALNFNQRNTYAVLDLGRVVHGRLEVTVESGRGAVVDIGWDERLWKNMYPLPNPGTLHPEWNQADSWVLDGSSRRISTIDTRTGRYVLIAVWGTAPVRLSNIRVVEERYPVTQGADPDFGDAQLNTIWRVGRDTAMINMTDAYADPWRERGQWWGDATVVDAVNAAVFKDNALLRRGLLLMAEQFAEMPSPAMAPHGIYAGNLHDYAMLWVQGVRSYIDRTGDTSILVECYPVIRLFITHLATYENKATGLLDMPKLGWWQTAFIDWSAYYNVDGSMSHGQSTPLNAMYYGTLKDAAAIAAALKDDAQSAAWLARADQVRDSMNKTLYLPVQKRYASTIIDGVVVSPTLFAQAWPLAYGVTPADRQDDVANALLELISKDMSRPNVQPYGMHWVLMALGKTGRVQEALNLIKLYYGYMLDRGATTWWETTDANQIYSKSLSHGWGSAPTWFLSVYVPQITNAMSYHIDSTPREE